ncbi:kinase-like domain-containing protein [Glomus cerebriforme]|uniref:Kinase-like domain-containing protein n=1 Tax=Glomus cerebriforme TaxID=658196 RepID=A0A397T6G2_9GLOM|nr:kinase-like domain-containing protein [Glomus cerebriforme]
MAEAKNKSLDVKNEVISDISSSKLSFADDIFQISFNAGEAIIPFIPLIGRASTAISDIIQIYKQSQYNKKICSSLLDRARLAEIAIDQLIRRRKDKNKIKEFKDITYYNHFFRFVDVLVKIRNFTKDISQLRKISRVYKSTDIKEKFESLTTEYDNAMKDLKFSIIIDNAVQRQMDQESLKSDIEEVQKSIKKMDRDLNEKIDLIYEEVQEVRKSKDDKDHEVKKIESTKLTDPAEGRKGDTRGSVKRRIFMNSIEVACKPIKDTPQREVAMLKKVTQSPNIIQFYGLTTYDGNDIMILEWAEYGNLQEYYSKNKGIIDWETKLNYALDICRGIAYLNALEIYHHNLRCKNVMLTKKNTAKLTGFGLSRDMNKSTTSLGDSLDVCCWTAPEKLKDIKFRYNHKCEIFGFGMLLWELAFEKRPYENKEDKDIESFVIKGGREEILFDSASPETTKIQKGFEKIIRGAWNQDPDCRTSISKLLNDLDALTMSGQEENNNNGNENPNYEDDFDFGFDSLNEELEPIPLKEGVEAYYAKDYENAWKCFERQAELNNSIGKHWKARYLWERKNNHEDKMTAFTLFKEAADDDVAEAQYYYACVLKDSKYKKVNPEDDFLKYLQSAANNGNGPAQFQIGEAYYKGIPKRGFEKDLEKAMIWYKRAALQGYDKAEKKLKELNVNLDGRLMISQ